MTQAILTATNILSQSIEGLLDLIKDFRENLQAKKMVRKTKRELNALDDFALKDLGISRGDITSIANGTFYDNRLGKIKPTIEQENENLKGWV
jgi:uncharacterized protein YjiS (DUF1127 family)